MESISRISSLLETARDLTLEAARDVGPRKPTKALPVPQIKKLLDSRTERDVLDGLRRVISMQYANPPQPTLTFFAVVLKTLSTPYPSTRPLVYNYLIHHAELDPDTALLSINTIQKSLSDANPRVRAMALKTMSGIRIPMISQIVSLAVKKGVSDLSPLVRKAAALACVKCVRLDENTRPQVEEYLATLLLDKQYYVAGAAVQAFMEVCPERLDLVHPAYRRLCKMVVDMDEWGQLAMLRLIPVYARKCFPRRTKRVRRAQTREEKAKDFYEDLEPKEEEEEAAADYDEVEIMDPDLDLFLTSIHPLLQSRNSAVIIAVTRAYLYLSPQTHLPHTIGPLIALLRSPQDIQQVALHNILQVCIHDPKPFAPYIRHFLVRSTEPSQIRTLKLELLTLLFPHCGKEVQDLILAELEHFSHGHDPDLVRESVRAIGRCAQVPSARTSRRCLSLLLKQIHSADSNLVGEAIEVIRHLIQRSPDEHRKTVVRLAKNLDSLVSPSARASIIWLVGEFAGMRENTEGESIAADVLRILVKGYADEEDEVKGQIVLLAAKVYLGWCNRRNEKRKALEGLDGEEWRSDGYDALEKEDEGGFEEDSTKAAEKAHPIELLYQHSMLLARYTPSYDLRDRARLYRALLAVPTSTELASLLLLAPKPVPVAPSPGEARKGFLLGSASLVIGAGGLQGREALPDWVVEGDEPDPDLRAEGKDERAEYVPAGSVVVSAGTRLDEALVAEGGKSGGKGRGRTLNDWLNDDEEEGTESDEEEEDGESEEEDGSEETEEEESSEEDEEDDEEDESAGLVR
ncbi:AP-3 complex subunit beta [Recurvomyces mirabilis]|uniref:AP-3 complex subunit beta n=1 Tax=Recurvomyces mirabilis TaxID=574656 RepID=A0AAE0TRX1_9PEZI|nr:AP-3 complex subunit beta [Recurvomyces mirabilis]KAK5160785.1 AP-3 complex subunit beta [Recurvomyces mirabilis]